jgi:hypothetical protein
LFCHPSKVSSSWDPRIILLESRILNQLSYGRRVGRRIRGRSEVGQFLVRASPPPQFGSLGQEVPLTLRDRLGPRLNVGF